MSRFLKLFFPFAFLTGLLLLAGLGCKNTQNTLLPAQPITLEYWTVFDDVDALQPLINAYKQQRPYLTINVRQLRIDEFYSRLLEALAEDKGPDIISIRNRWVNGFQNKLAAMPPKVSDVLVQVEQGAVTAKTTIQGQTIALPTIDQIDREFVKAVKDDVVRGDKIYGMPLSFDTMALYYNKDLLDRAGVAEPPKTWEQFQAAVKKLTKYNRTTGKITQAGVAMGTGANVPGSDDLLYILFRQSSLPFVDATGRAVFNRGSQNAESGTATVVNFYTDFANPARDTYTWNETMGNAVDGFVNGSVAFFFGYNYHYPLIKTRAPQLNFGILPMLQLNPENQVNVANYWVDAVTSKSKHPNEAWGLVNYLAHSPATKQYLDATDRPTALRSYVLSQNEKPELAPFVSQVLIADNWYKGKNYEAAQKALGDMLHEWLAVPADVDNAGELQQQILNRAVEKVNQTL